MYTYICKLVKFRDHQKAFNTPRKKVNVDFRRLEKMYCKCVIDFRWAERIVMLILSRNFCYEFFLMEKRMLIKRNCQHGELFGD